MLAEPCTFWSSTFLFSPALRPQASSLHLPALTKSRVAFGRAGAEFPGARLCRPGGHSLELVGPRTADRCRQNHPSAAAQGLAIGVEPRHSDPEKGLGGGGGGESWGGPPQSDVSPPGSPPLVLRC